MFTKDLMFEIKFSPVKTDQLKCGLETDPIDYVTQLELYAMLDASVSFQENEIAPWLADEIGCSNCPARLDFRDLPNLNIVSGQTGKTSRSVVGQCFGRSRDWNHEELPCGKDGFTLRWLKKTDIETGEVSYDSV